MARGPGEPRLSGRTQGQETQQGKKQGSREALCRVASMCLHVTSPSPRPSKFSIVSMVTAVTLTSGIDLESICPI